MLERYLEEINIELTERETVFNNKAEKMAANLEKDMKEHIRDEITKLYDKNIDRMNEAYNKKSKFLSDVNYVYGDMQYTPEEKLENIMQLIKDRFH